MFDERDFHTEIITTCRQLFVDGHFSPAILAGCLRINERVRGATGRCDLDGVDLMSQAFRPEKPMLAFNPLTTDTDLSEQRGLMFLFMGIVAAFRNPNAHHLRSETPVRTLEHLALMSLLLRFLDSVS
jgi:uncharacterized protein (TIGR02391 family)